MYKTRTLTPAQEFLSDYSPFLPIPLLKVSLELKACVQNKIIKSAKGFMNELSPFLTIHILTHIL